MPKTRTLEAEFWDDKVIDGLTRDERLLAAAIITLLADDEGRFIAEPSVIKKRVFGADLDITIADVDAMVIRIASAWKNLKLYTVADQRYGWLSNFQRKQGIRYVVKSKLPKFETDNALQVNDCRTLPKSSPNSPSIGLSRVVKKTLSGLQPDPVAEETIDEGTTRLLDAYNTLAERWGKPKITAKRIKRLARRIRECDAAMNAVTNGQFSFALLLARVERQSEFFRDRWNAWDLEWFVATRRGEFTNAMKTWAYAYRQQDRSPPASKPVQSAQLLNLIEKP